MARITQYLNRRINSILDDGILRNVVIDCIIVTEEVDNTLNKEGLILVEAKDCFTPVPGLKHHAYRIDKQLGDGGPGRQRHIHGYRDGKEFFAMNADGTAHDGYHHVEIPKEWNPLLNSKGFPIPANNIIELRQYNSAGQLLCENVKDATTDEALNAVMPDIQRIAIVKANVDEAEVTMWLNKRNDFQYVEKLLDVPQDKIDRIKRELKNILKPTGKYADDVSDIMTSYDTPRHLYVAWRNNN